MKVEQNLTPSKVLSHLSSDFLETATREQLLRVARTFIGVEAIIDSVYDLKRLLELIMRESESVVNAETSSLLLYDKETDELFFEVALGPKGSEVKKNRLPLSESSIASYSAVNRVPVNIDDVSTDPRWNRQVDMQTQFTTRSILAVPMLRQDRLIGIIEVLNKKGGDRFSEEDMKTLMVLASLAAIAIENAQLYQENLQAERLAALGLAVANISHYVKNILTGLKGSVNLIDSSLKEGDYEILERATLVLKRSYNRIESLVKDMLSYSKGREPEPVETNPNRVVQEIYDLMCEVARSKAIKLTVELDPDLPILYIDPEILERVLLNLVTNGLDAVYEQRQVNPTLEGKISISTRYQEGKLVVSVSDNGTGISEAEQARIWNAFYSTKGSTGTGLGLAVSKKMVEECGGKLTLTSKEGSGACFTLVFPAPVAERAKVDSTGSRPIVE